MKKILLISAVMLCALVIRAEDSNTFTSATVGFSVKKPAQWYFMTAEANTENLNNVRMKDEEFQKMAQKYATVPLVVMTRYQEPYDGLNPSFKVNVRSLGNLDGTNPVSIIQLVRGSLQKAFKDYKEIQPPIETEVAGFKAAYMKIHYTLETSESRSFPTSSEMWIIPRGKFFFLIGVGSSQVSDKTEQEEIQSIIKSMKIDK